LAGWWVGGRAGRWVGRQAEIGGHACKQFLKIS